MIDIGLAVDRRTYQGYDDNDLGANAEECALKWGFINGHSVLVLYGTGRNDWGKNRLVVYAPSKSAGFIARKKVFRKLGITPDVVVGGTPDRSIIDHWAYKGHSSEN